MARPSKQQQQQQNKRKHYKTKPNKQTNKETKKQRAAFEKSEEFNASTSGTLTRNALLRYSHISYIY